MRILQLVSTLQFGGVERMAAELALEQKRAGHEPAICCLYRREGELVQPLEAAGVPVFGTDEPIIGGARRVPLLPATLRQWPADIVHSPLNYSVLAQVLGNATAGGPRPPFVITQQSVLTEFWAHLWRGWLNGRLARPFVTRFTAVSR